MHPYECLEPERRLSGNAMENIMDFFGARAAFERKCNGKYNGMSGARAAFERK